MFESDLVNVLGIPLHRCSRCGGECFNLEDKPLTGEEFTAFTDPNLQEAHGVKRIAVHSCGDGGAGLAMLFGLMSMPMVEHLKQRFAEHAEAQKQQQGEGGTPGSNKGLN